MKKRFYHINYKGIYPLFVWVILFSSCKKELEFKSFGNFAETFPANDKEASAAINYSYMGLVQGTEWSLDSWSMRAQDLAVTDEMDCNWGWDRLRSLNFDPDYDIIKNGYEYYTKLISQITLYIGKVSDLNMNDQNLKARYIGELKGLRAHYTYIMFSHFGPVPLRMNPADVNNADAPILERPTEAEIVNWIISDYTDAIAVLPNRFEGGDYGRFSKAAALTGRMKLYMQQKRWQEAIQDGEEIGTLGYSLISNYNDNFGPQSKGGNAEIILPVVCTPTAQASVNMWFAYTLPNDYMDMKGISLTTWNGYRMPWATYRKFDTVNDQRTLRLLRYYPSNARGSSWVWRDALTGDTATSLSGGTNTPVGLLTGNAVMTNRGKFTEPDNRRGAIMMKFAVDESGVNAQKMNMDIIIYRYADVLLLLAEAYNNTDQTGKAIELINEVRRRAGLEGTPASSKEAIQTAIENERLFELYLEGTRRDDLLRWGKFIERAIKDGSASFNPNFNAGSVGADKYKLYPIPRSVITQSNGLIKQNPGYE